MLDREYVRKLLSKIPGLLYLNKKSKDFSYVNPIFEFLLKNEKNILLNPKLKPEDITYNNSIFHFLLYYTYYPKDPFIFLTNENLIFGAFKDRKYKQIEFSFLLTKNISRGLNQLNTLLSTPEFNSVVKKYNTKQILIRDIDDSFVNKLKKSNNGYLFRLESLKELNYAIYDTNNTLDLDGGEFSNLRWHLNNFKKNDFKVEEVPLADAIKPVIHLIGKWRKKASENRGFSYINVRSDKLGARLFGDIEKYFVSEDLNGLVGPENILSKVLKVNGEVAAFNLGFPLGIYKKQKVFAHAIGISDLSISHLAEYAQYDFWKQVKKKGYNYINDGPTWKKDLKTYKNKFRPTQKKRYYWATLSLKI